MGVLWGKGRILVAVRARTWELGSPPSPPSVFKDSVSA